MNRTSRPRLANDEIIDLDAGARARPRRDANATVDLDGRRRQIAQTRRTLLENLRPTIGAGLVVGSVAMFVYVGLAASSVLITHPLSERNVVLRNAYPPEQVPSGAIMLVSPQPSTDMLSRASEAFTGVTGEAMVKVAAGPFGQVRTAKNGAITLGGADTGLTGNLKPTRLDRQYLVTCLSGNCEPGAVLVIAQDSLVGEVRGRLGLTGVKKISPAEGAA